MILFLLSELEKKIESMYSLTEGANEDMSKQDLLLIILKAKTELKIVMY